MSETGKRVYKLYGSDTNMEDGTQKKGLQKMYERLSHSADERYDRTISQIWLVGFILTGVVIAAQYFLRG